MTEMEWYKFLASITEYRQQIVNQMVDDYVKLGIPVHIARQQVYRLVHYREDEL